MKFEAVMSHAAPKLDGYVTTTTDVQCTFRLKFHVIRVRCRY